jgi:chaperonin GroEL (HSP60 family)
MVAQGVVDSYHVVKTALLDGISVGSMVLTTEAVIVKEKVYIGEL